MRDDWFSGRRRRTRTVKVWTALSRPCPAGQIDNGGLFSKIRTKSGKRTESRQKKSGQTEMQQHFLQNSGQNSDSGQNPDNRHTPDTIFCKIRTKTRQGQDTDNAVRRGLFSGMTGCEKAYCPDIKEDRSIWRTVQYDGRPCEIPSGYSKMF